MDFHCGSTAGRDDPECGMEGFGAPPPHAKPSDPSSCPWAAIRSHCRSQLGGATAGCRLLAAYGALGEAPVIPADASSLRAASSVLKAAAEKEAARAREAFDAFAISREKQRRRMVARYTAYRRLFRALDGDLDKRIVASELRPISRAVRAAKASRSPQGSPALLGR